MDVTVADCVTVSVAVAPGVPAAEALIVVLPALSGLQMPPETVATLVFEEAQVTRPVAGAVDPSL